MRVRSSSGRREIGDTISWVEKVGFMADSWEVQFWGEEGASAEVRSDMACMFTCIGVDELKTSGKKMNCQFCGLL